MLHCMFYVDVAMCGTECKSLSREGRREGKGIKRAGVREGGREGVGGR